MGLGRGIFFFFWGGGGGGAAAIDYAEIYLQP